MPIKKVVLILAALLLLVNGCSNSSIDGGSSKSDSKSTEQSASDSASVGSDSQENSKEDAKQEHAATERRVIHTATVNIEVKKFEVTQQKIEDKVKEYGGYIVESTSFDEGEGRLSGVMTARIPEQNFQQFLHDTEEAAVKVLERNMKGEDVTEEYVDLQSRLKSKRAVEARLLDFMKKAAKTEDLLKISADLASVQEEMETILGRMKFLDNQVAYSTVQISMHEDLVVVPDLESSDLNTWEKTKRQFAASLNFLLGAASALFVFIIGNLPVLVLLSIICFICYRFIGKRKKK
ncbi:DUF4349 domain-containing protein [Peribacillus sp. SCS-155]|uniref:DUF4349 domain-containing protein n=1 Tax=Peribacillus sedimenti TaxID=3115297 RepID=UPI003905F01F